MKVGTEQKNEFDGTHHSLDYLREKTSETKTFSTDFLEETVKEIILPLLQENELTRGIESLNVKANGNEINLNIKVEREMDTSVNVQANLKSWRGALVIKNYKIYTMWPLQNRIEKVMVPILSKVSKKLKNYIEGQESKKIKEMKIENGELIVTFELPKEEKELELGVEKATASAPPDETPDPALLRRQAERERIEKLRKHAQSALEEVEAHRARKAATVAVEKWTPQDEARLAEIKRMLEQRGEK